MNILTLLHDIRDAVHDDAATQAWCTTNYNRNHKVYVGIDVRNPPGKDHYPIVHIFPLSKSIGYELENQDHIIGVTCGIYEPDMLSTGKTDAVEYEGIDHIEEFRKLIETAVAGTSMGELLINTLTIEYETIEFFPFFLATMEFKLTKPYYQGDNVFA